MAHTKNKSTPKSKPTLATAPGPAKATRKKTPTEKGKAHQAAVKRASTKNKTVDELDSDDDVADDSEDPDIQEGGGRPDRTLSFDWSDHTLSESLLALIYESRDIKRALYLPPGPNASTANGGGRTKTAAHWQLCLKLYSSHPKYAAVLAAVVTAKDRTVYANKIKNRLRAMAKLTRNFMNEMGETGAGIRSAAEIDMSVTNSFTTKWQEILPIAPWFFEMREPIAQRPNLVPAGLGNSASGIDDDVLGTGAPPPYDSDSDTAALEIPAQTLDVDISSDGDVEGRTLSKINDDDEHFPPPDQLSSSFVSSDRDYHPSDSLDGNKLEDADEEDVDKKKKKRSKGKGRIGQTPALPGTSTPASTPVPSTGSKASKKSKVVEFAEIAKTEELTRQKELELATLRAKQSLKALEEVKRALDKKREDRKREDKMARQEERRAKLKMREMKLQHLHELRMAQLAGSSSHAGRFFDPPLSMYASSVAQHSHADSEYGDLGSVSGGAGSSTESSFDVDYQLPSFPPFP